MERSVNMVHRVNIPVRTVRSTEDALKDPVRESRIVSSQSANPSPNSAGRRPTDSQPETERADHAVAPAATDRETVAPDDQGELQAWRDRALHLQADMDNYRKRQRRLAQAEIESERERLLGSFLQIVDNLERALDVQEAARNGSHPVRHGADRLPSGVQLPSGEDIHRGVELTHRAALHLLQKEGVEPIEARNQPFDPNWHEAVTTVPRNGHQMEPGTVIQVLQPGYRLGDRLLRPARVVVAV